MPGTTRRVDAATFSRLWRRALHAGATPQLPGYLEWHTSPWCGSPHEIYVTGHKRVSRARGGFYLDRTSLGGISILTACRQCHGCARHRSRLWSARAKSELARAARSWFVTLTVCPERRALIDYAIAKARGRGRPALEGDALMLAQHDIISKEITRYLKRVRSRSNASLKYLLVLEAHKDGYPHYHLLIHEVTNVPVRWRDLAEAWSWGFVTAKLVADGPQVARYVAKYISKTLRARVRASLAYGADLSDSGPDHVMMTPCATLKGLLLQSVGLQTERNPDDEP